MDENIIYASHEYDQQTAFAARTKIRSTLNVILNEVAFGKDLENFDRVTPKTQALMEIKDRLKVSKIGLMTITKQI